MSAARLVLRIVVATITVIAVGAILVLGLTVVEPFHAAFGGSPVLGVSDPGGGVLPFMVAGGLALLLVLIVWFVGAPIQRDKRQQFRR